MSKSKRFWIKNVYCQTAQELNYENKFDGIWTCASLLHVIEEELNICFNNCSKSLKEEGIKDYPKDANLEIIDIKIPIDVRPNRDNFI